MCCMCLQWCFTEVEGDSVPVVVGERQVARRKVYTSGVCVLDANMLMWLGDVNGETSRFFRMDY